MSAADTEQQEWDSGFQHLAFAAGFAAPPSARFWVFPDPVPYQMPGLDILPGGAFVGFGASAGFGHADGSVDFHHQIYSTVKMDRAGWLNLMRLLASELRLTDDEIASVRSSPADAASNGR